MELNYNSIWAKLYRWFYYTDIMPNSLCSYFWKLVFAVVLSVALFPVYLPGLIINKLDREFFLDRFGDKVMMGMVVYIGIFIFFITLFSLSIFWIQFPNTSVWSHFQIAGLGVFVGIIVVSLMFCLPKIGRSFKNSLFGKSTLVFQYTKAIFNKVCPKINWK